MLPKTLKPDFYRDNRVLGQKPERDYHFYNNRSVNYTNKLVDNNKGTNYINKTVNDNNKDGHRKNYQSKPNMNNRFNVRKSTDYNKSLSFLNDIMVTGNSEKKK
jgi:hypothetical protein